MRNIQQMFTFKSECLSKFGEGMGEKVWEAVNKCFDALPLAAVIDDKVNINYHNNMLNILAGLCSYLQ